MAGEEPGKKEDVAEQSDRQMDETPEAEEEKPAEQTKSEGSEKEETSEVDKLIQEAVASALAEQQDTVLRAQAEVQNMRRRCEADVERAHKYALEKFSTELLTVVDNLERALQAVPDTQHENVRALYEGVELTLKGFLETFNKFNIEQIDPVGEPFDPQLHEAISMIANDEVEPNTVITVVQKGYVLNGRVIRPAMVIVARGAG